VIIISYERFENLDEAKKQKIINAGFQVFAEHGYAKASVDEIVKVADISKGSLFYYFESKKNFYLYLYNYCGEQMEQQIDHPKVDGKPSYLQYTDFFERLSYIQELKTKHSADYPYMYNFMKKVVFDTSPVIRSEISMVNAKYIKERAMAFYQGLDYFKFKEGIDPLMVVQLLTWISEGCANAVVMKTRLTADATQNELDFNDILSMYCAYVDLLRRTFYKEEYL
jgi:AcrR family transcriptional regulator